MRRAQRGASAAPWSAFTGGPVVLGLERHIDLETVARVWHIATGSRDVRLGFLPEKPYGPRFVSLRRELDRRVRNSNAWAPEKEAHSAERAPNVVLPFGVGSRGLGRILARDASWNRCGR